MTNRGYSERMINSAIDRARKIPRQVALKKVIRRQTEKRPVFALTYDPRLPPIQSIQAKHWRAMVRSTLTPTLLRSFLNHLLPRIRGKRISRTTLSGLRCPLIQNHIHPGEIEACRNVEKIVQHALILGR